MKITGMTFGEYTEDDGDFVPVPETVSLTMTAKEALFVTLVLGKMNGIQSAEVMKNGEYVISDVYNGFTGGVWNRFFDDGADEAKRVIA